MIIQLLLSPIFGLLGMLVGLLPGGGGLPQWVSSCVELIGYGLYFFPLDIWVFMIVNFLAWQSMHMAWAIIEWIYKKIPGVD